MVCSPAFQARILLTLRLLGTLDVRVRGNTLVPPSIAARLTILCAILRQVHLVLQVSLFTTELFEIKPDVFFADQLSACVPLLRLFFPNTRMLFYCHFPDKLLAYRENALKKLYRIPFDAFEEWSTGLADAIAVNSNFTRSIFAEAFPALKNKSPSVIYPCVDVTAAVSEQTNGAIELLSQRKELWKGKRVVLSINRFERKKDIGLAIKAFAGLPENERRGSRLVLAGGYDPRMAENVQYHKELEQLADARALKHATAKNLATALAVPEDTEVVFLLSVPSSLKTSLLQAASLLVYTPKFEHFGIVPLEAMLERVPVLAAVTGGPPETVVDGETGWLRSVDDVAEWTRVIARALLMTEAQVAEMGDKGRQRVVQVFSQGEMGRRLEEAIQTMDTIAFRPPLFGTVGFVAIIVLGGLIAAVLNTWISKIPVSWL